MRQDGEQEGRQTPGQALRGAIVSILPLLAGLGLLLAGAATLPALFFLQVLDRVLTTGSTATLLWLLGALAIGFAMVAAAELLRALALDLAARRMVRCLTGYALPAQVRSARGSEPLRDLEALRRFVVGTSLGALLDLALAPPLIVVLALLHPAYAVFGIVAVLLLAGLNLAAGAASEAPLAAANAHAAGVFGAMGHALRGAEAVVAMGLLPRLAARWEADERAMRREAGSALRRTRAAAAATRAARLLMTAGLVALGVVLVMGGSTSPGTMIAAPLLLARVLAPFEQIAATLRQLGLARAAWQRLLQGLGASETKRDATAIPCSSGRLVVERLVHVPKGAERPVLRGVSFAVEPGEVLAIIGPSGAGKSTLLRLILGMEQPSSGTVTLDGYPTHLWPRAEIAHHVGYLPQAIALVEGTIADNIARLERPDLGRLIAAARRAGLHETIARLKHGYATPISETGFVLSEGQRQRLGLARAWYGRPKLLVLDEPNAFLDEAGEAWLVTALAALKAEGCAVVLVTHRPRLAQHADRVLVLQGGMVERLGPRATVMGAPIRQPVRLVKAESHGRAAR